MSDGLPPARKIRVHIETTGSLGEPFRITRDMLDAAGARRPGVLSRCALSFGANPAAVAAAITDSDALLAWRFPHRDLGRLAPRLRWIQLPDAGADHLLPLDWLAACGGNGIAHGGAPGDSHGGAMGSNHGIVLTDARGAHRPKIGEVLLLGLLTLNSAMPTLLRHQGNQSWQQIFSTGIAGKTVLILGVGEAGGAAAEQATRFGLRVIGTRRSAAAHPAVDAMYPPAATDALLPQADFVVVTAPATPETTPLLDAGRIALMRPRAGVVSLARRGVVDLPALVDALRSGHLGGAVLDVQDPTVAASVAGLWSCPNLIALPHCLSNDPDRFMANVLDLFLENLQHFILDEPLRNRVQPHRGY